MGNNVSSTISAKARKRFKWSSRSSAASLSTTTSLSTTLSSDTKTSSGKGSVTSDGYNDWISRVLDADNESLLDYIHIMHYMLKNSWNGNFSAPVQEELKSGITVLDVGCGPGTWVLDMASTHIRSNFIGIDISPAYPTQIKPANTQFLTCDVLEGLPFEDDFFDFIYLRFVNKAFTREEWNDTLLNELLRVLKPGGWIETMEQGVEVINPTPTLAITWKAGRQLLEDRGVFVGLAYELEHLLNAHPQTTNVEMREIEHRIGPRGGKDGEIWATHLIQTLEAASPSLIAYLNWTPEQYQAFSSEYVKQLHDPKCKTKTTTYRVFCQKREYDDKV